METEALGQINSIAAQKQAAAMGLCSLSLLCCFPFSLVSTATALTYILPEPRTPRDLWDFVYSGIFLIELWGAVLISAVGSKSLARWLARALPASRSGRVHAAILAGAISAGLGLIVYFKNVADVASKAIAQE